MTLPLGVLKSDAVQFCPPLPPFKQEAIDKLEMGTENRIAMIFPQVVRRHLPPSVIDTAYILRVATTLTSTPCSFHNFALILLVDVLDA